MYRGRCRRNAVDSSLLDDNWQSLSNRHRETDGNSPNSSFLPSLLTSKILPLEDPYVLNSINWRRCHCRYVEYLFPFGRLFRRRRRRRRPRRCWWRRERKSGIKMTRCHLFFFVFFFSQKRQRHPFAVHSTATLIPTIHLTNESPLQYQPTANTTAAAAAAAAAMVAAACLPLSPDALVDL